MASRGITDKVAVVGMGCTRFGERWDSSTEDLILEAFAECIDVDAEHRQERHRRLLAGHPGVRASPA